MLDDYFSIEISPEGSIVTLPVLLDDFVPDLSQIPNFVMGLATEVNWEDEEGCFDTFCSELARFYSVHDSDEARYDTDQHKDPEEQGKLNSQGWKRMIEHGIFGCAKKMLKPPKTSCDDLTFVQVANLPDLYKVFERC